jgi:hypothetical protein
MKIDFDRELPGAVRLTVSIAFALVGLAYLVLCWTNEVYDIRGDGPGYMLGAAYFSPFQDATPVLAEYAKSLIYPPLFPVLIGLFGASGLAAHLVVAFSLLLAVLAIYLWLRTEGLPMPASAAAALLFALLPAAYLQSLNIWTENTFLMFNLAAVYFVARAQSNDEQRQSYWWLAAAMVAAATLTRVAALPLLGAFLLILVIQRPRQFILLGLSAALPFVLWLIWSKLTQTGIGSYTAHWATIYQQDPFGRLLLQIREESRALLQGWQAGFAGPRASPFLDMLVGVFGLMGLAGWITRLVSLKFDAIYFALYALLLLTWPHPEEALRYGYVLFPFLVAYAVVFALRIDLRAAVPGKKLLVTWSLCVLMTLVMLPGLIFNVQRFLMAVPAEISNSNRIDEWYADAAGSGVRISQFHHRLQQHLQQIKLIVPADACIFSAKPTVITFHTQRTSYGPPPAAADAPTFARQITRCRYVYGLGLVSPTYNVALYPINRLGTRAKILSVMRFPGPVDAPIIGVLAEILPAGE